MLTSSSVDPRARGSRSPGKMLAADERNLLIFDFLRLAVSLRPRFFVLENVPPLRTFADPEYPDCKLLDRLLADFAAEGYQWREPRIVNASNYGVPQDRRRLIIIGAREGETLPDYPPALVRPLPKRPSNGSQPDVAVDDDALPSGPSVWDALGDLPDLDQFETLRDRDELALDEHLVLGVEETASPYARRLMGLDVDPTDMSYPRVWTRTLLTSSRRTVHTAKTTERFEQTQPGETEVTSRYYRLHPDGLCSTLRAGTGYERGSFMAPRPIHPVEHRVISVREAARLHSFPDWFRFHYSKWHGFRQIGNSLPPLLGRAIGAELINTMQIEVSRPTERQELGDPALLTMATYAAADHFKADLDSAPTHKSRHRPKRNGVGVPESIRL